MEVIGSIIAKGVIAGVGGVLLYEVVELLSWLCSRHDTAGKIQHS